MRCEGGALTGAYDVAELAAKLAALFAGDLAADGAVDPESVELAVRLAVEAGLSALPDEVMIDGATVPVGVLVNALLRPAIEMGIKALIDASRPARLIVNNPASVTGAIHD